MKLSFHFDSSLKRKSLIIIGLALPAMIENILQTVVGFVDTLFVSKLGLTAVTAVGIANTLLAVYFALFTAVGVGASAMISQAIGAKKIEKAKETAQISILVSVILGLLLGLLSYYFAPSLLNLMGAKGQTLQVAITYFRIVAVPSVLMALMFIFGSILRASGDTKTPMKISLIINLIHIPLDFFFIFGIGPLDGWGVAGAAWATVCVRIVGVVLFVHFFKKSDVDIDLFNFSKFQNRDITRKLISLSIPTALERLIMRLGQVLYFGLILQIGSTVFAAHSIAGTIETFAYMPGYGLAIAATTLVGQSIGANQTKLAFEYGILTTGIAIVFMSLIGVIMFILAPWFASWFTSDGQAQEMVITALRIDAFAQPALAVGLVLAGALQGAGDTKSPLYSTLIGMWIIRVAGVYIFGIVLNMGIAGVWLSIALDLYLRAFFLSYRFKHHLGIQGSHTGQ
jgi:putative MATE family efflux protein